MDAEKKTFVWRLDETDMTVEKAHVGIGELTGTDGIEVLGGLGRGDVVVTSGVTRLQAGMKVTVWDEAE